MFVSIQALMLLFGVVLLGWSLGGHVDLGHLGRRPSVPPICRADNDLAHLFRLRVDEGLVNCSSDPSIWFAYKYEVILGQRFRCSLPLGTCGD